MKLKATSFATPQDKAAYNRCIAAGHSDHYCTSTPSGGDNCIGAWGDDTSSLTNAYCAIHHGVRGSKYRVQLYVAGSGRKIGNPFVCSVGDLGPVNVIDLNPGSLIAAGLSPTTELLCEADVTPL